MWHQLMLIMIFAQASAAQAPAPPAPAAAGDSCTKCHLEMGDPLAVPVKLSAHDIHVQNGLSCSACHGGDPTKSAPDESMNPRKGFVGKPDRKKIGEFCASCHSRLEYMRKYNPQARVDQYSEYLTSVHGKKNQAGDQNVATCIDCHGAHGIREAKDPNSPVYVTNVAATCSRCHSDVKRMAPYDIRTNQLELYTKSVHGEALMKDRDLSAPTCNSCHGNHGATPPGVDAVANVCGQCHVTQWDLFNQSPHRKAFADNKWPACVTCHQNHEILHPTDAMIGVEESSTCVICHQPDSAGYQAAQQMKSEILSLQSRLSSATQVLDRAQKAGMEVSGPIYQISESRNQLVLARVQVHRFDTAVLKKTISQGTTVAAACEQSGWKALQDLAYRRKGMAVSAVILLCMIGLLLLRIRQLKS